MGNLILPPDPQTKHAPACLDDSSAEIIIGWDESLRQENRSASSTGKTQNAILAVPDEIARMMLQTSECLRWNAALALYILGVDLSVSCMDGFQHNMAKWQKSREQARLLITSDLLDRASRTLESRSSAADASALDDLA